MLRREFLTTILFSKQINDTLKTIFNEPLKQDSVKINKNLKNKLNKIIDFIKDKGEYTGVLINKEIYNYHEFVIPNKYKLQANESYFSIIRYNNNSSMYDFNFDGIPEIQVLDHNLGEDDIINNLEDAINANNNKKYKNNHLKILKNSNEINNLFEKDIDEIYSLLEF